MSRTSRLSLLLPASAVVLTLALAGCSADPSIPAAAAPDDAAASKASAIPDTASLIDSVEEDTALSGVLPAGIAEDGVLTVGSNVQAPPNNFFAEDGSTIVGNDYDIIRAIAKKLGLEVEYQNMEFQALITSLQSGRVEATIAAMNDTAERQKTIDFVDYLISGMAIMVQKGNPTGVKGPDTLCGKGIAVVTGTTQQTFAESTSAACVEDGKQPLEIVVTDSSSQNQTQLRTGRIDAIVTDLPAAVYISKTTKNGEAFEVVPGDVINGAPYGIGINKDNPELRDAMAAALDELIADGTYGKILDAWGVSDGKIAAASVNGGA